METMDQSPTDTHFISCEQGNDEGITVLLNGNLSIVEVIPLRAQLQEVLSQEKNVTLNGGSIERVDTAALQVLWAFNREATQRQLSVKWAAASDALLQAATLLGLAASMGLATRSN